MPNTGTRRRLPRAAFVVLIVALAVAVGTLVPRPLVHQAESGGGTTRRILVLANAIHTDIAVPLDDELRTRFAFLEDSGLPIGEPGARWLIIGRGGRAFYLETPTWSDLRPLPLAKALTVDRAVMHVEIAGAIGEPQPGVTGLDIDSRQFGKLLDFVGSGFVEGADGPVLVVGRSYGLNDRFYEATGLFNALVGCNTWTASALREAGVRTGWWNPLPQLLFASIWLYN